MKTCQSHFVFFFFIFLFFTHKTCICEYCLNGIYNGLYMISYIYRRADGQSTPHFVYFNDRFIRHMLGHDECFDRFSMCVLFSFLLQGENNFCL